MKKRIGISFTHTAYDRYVDWFYREGTPPDVEWVELNYEKNNYIDIFGCDGFILTGGVDIHPSLYNGTLDYVNKPTSFAKERDLFEAMIYRYARLQQLPVLAICRGLQLINVLEGGALCQDLGEEKNKIHKKAGDDKKHTITVVENSLLHTLTGERSGTVNSAHHQSIDPAGLAPTLQITATAADGTIEAVEYKDPSPNTFLLGVQWHPERLNQLEEAPFSAPLLNGFLQTVHQMPRAKCIVRNPATEQVLHAFNEDDESSLQKKYTLLCNGQQQWKMKPLRERIALIEKYTLLLEEHKEQLSLSLTQEVGKPLSQSRNEVQGAIARTRWMTEHATTYLDDEVMTHQEGLTEMIRYEPLGVIGNISAWNYPYLVGTNVFVPALLAGNAVLYKPSEWAICTGRHIDYLLKQAGIPDNVFQLATGGAFVGESMLALPLNGYFFTGSYRTGQYLYEKVAPKMVVCQCELGGKDPLYVTDDITDIPGVAAATADGAFYNNGQSCCAVERIYVQEKIADAYIDAFVNTVQSWKVGNPMEEGVYFGPLTRKEQLAVLDSQVNDALQKGARLLLGGKRKSGNGYYFEPTVLCEVTHNMSVMRDESFGPIIGIMTVKDDADAIAKMKDTSYGLTAAVYSNSRSRALSILEQLDCGTGYWNCCDRVSAAVPWSGRKHSGFGSTLSYAGLRAFTQPKALQLRG